MIFVFGIRHSSRIYSYSYSGFFSQIYSYLYSVLIFEPNIFVFVFGFYFWTEYIRIRIRFLFLDRIYSYSYSAFIFGPNLFVFVFGGQNTIRSPLYQIKSYQGHSLIYQLKDIFFVISVKVDCRRCFFIRLVCISLPKRTIWQVSSALTCIFDQPGDF